MTVSRDNILGIDPGTRDLGWAVISPSCRVLELGVVHQERDDSLAKSTDRQVRVHVQAALIRDLVRRHRIRRAVAEAASFNPRRFTMAVGLCMSIGALTGVAAALELELYELPPKRWQAAILGREPNAKGKLDYDEVFRRVAAYVGDGSTPAGAQLAAIPAARRNHALDAVGVGEFAVLCPDQLTRIGETQ